MSFIEADFVSEQLPLRGEKGRVKAESEQRAAAASRSPSASRRWLSDEWAGCAAAIWRGCDRCRAAAVLSSFQGFHKLIILARHKADSESSGDDKRKQASPAVRRRPEDISPPSPTCAHRHQ
ncbi:hypothetical protein MHYP_G00098350 [Metynnis hypsauchen]